LNEVEFPEVNEPQQQFKMCFDGCGVTNGTMGVLFAQGLGNQCDEVVSKVDDIISKDKRVTLNCLGLSRGGIACLMLSRKLHKHRNVDVNLLLFDPVPGNSITGGYFDLFHQTTAVQNIDLTRSRNLKNVLALYPYEPLDDIAFHAPLLPDYPESTNVEVDVILGCHQGALYRPGRLDTTISFWLIKEAMEKWGAIFGPRIEKLASKKSQESVLHSMNEEMDNKIKSVRCTHTKHGLKIVRREEAKYLNKYHERLCIQFGHTNRIESKHEFTYLLDITD
jgi:hypothetical protein